MHILTEAQPVRHGISGFSTTVESKQAPSAEEPTQFNEASEFIYWYETIALQKSLNNRNTDSMEMTIQEGHQSSSTDQQTPEAKDRPTPATEKGKKCPICWAMKDQSSQNTTAPQHAESQNQKDHIQ